MRRTRPDPFDSTVVGVEGFSLVEVLVAALVFATAAAALPQLFIAATRANRGAADTTWATTLATQKLEELRAQSSLDATLGEWVDHLDEAGGSADGSGAMPPAYTRRWWVEPLPSAPGSTVVIVVAVSRYAGADGDATGAPREVVRLAALRRSTSP